MGLAVVTGATGGLGWEVALGLVRAGQRTLLTGRDAGRGAEALARVKAAAPGAEASFALLDMASLAGIAAFASALDGPVSILVNNAAVMALPQRETTADGFERQFGVNYLGHFALTAHLLERLRGGRVVNVSSVAHRRGTIPFDDLQRERSYSSWEPYSASKLAMLMFALEGQRRSVAGGWGVDFLAAHPGWSATRIVLNGPGQGRPGLKARVMQAAFSILAQSAADGALPLLYAALDPAAQGGGYYGPCCWAETRGRPTKSRIWPQAQDQAASGRLWRESEALTGATFPQA